VSGPDSEFGVPFPGKTVPHAQRTRTGVRDTGQPFDWADVFGRTAPRVVDLGCGNGRYLIGSAIARPDHDHLGVDLVQVAIDHAAHRANARGLSNVRFVTGDENPWIRERLLPNSLDEIHVYHPQPYYEVADAARRQLTPEFFERAWTLLKGKGLLVLQTDNKSYWSYLLKAAAKHFDIEVVPGPWPDAPKGRTRREIIARKKGLAVWRMRARRRDIPQPIEIPRPDFDADRPRFKRARRKK
jgi:tRNA (guanine-N7-)-methyltransferase